jgi:hypothetical protein
VDWDSGVTVRTIIIADRRRRRKERLRAEFIAGAETEWLKRTRRPMTFEELERVLRRYPGDVLWRRTEAKRGNVRIGASRELRLGVGLEIVHDGSRKGIGEGRDVTTARHRPQLDGSAASAARPARHRGLGGLTAVEEVGVDVEPLIEDQPGRRTARSSVADLPDIY